MRRFIAITCVAATILLGLAGATGVAQAKVPGRNGDIVFIRTSSSGNNRMFVVDPVSGKLHRLMFPFGVDSPHWSPDGTTIAFNSGLDAVCPPTCVGHTVIIDPGTGQYRILPAATPRLFTSCTIWSPDASHFACEGGNDSKPRLNGVYTIRSSDGRGLMRITDANGMSDIPIDYSPDGSQLVFGRVGPDDSCTKRSALYVVSVEGSGLHRITPWRFCDDDGSWSPDGRWIAFEHRGSIFEVHPNGGGLRRIALKTKSRSFAGDISWSPDGEQLAFILFLKTGPHTFVGGLGTANTNGTDVHQLTVTPGSNFDHEGDWGASPPAS